ncbi:MAG: CheR family methyltransferase [Cyanobacteria bacterium P01_D01_bin.105]
MNNQSAQQGIEALLSSHMGLSVSSVGAESLARAIDRAKKALNISNTAVYLHHLKHSPAALEALVEAIVVPETSFFRNPESFDYLRRYISSQINSLTAKSSDASDSTPQKIWRILSIPCSTGEEPYSIAITLLEAGLSAKKFRVDGVDISTKALEKAKRGSFNRYSFRKTTTYSPERHIQQYFQRQGDDYCLHQQVRSQVYFQQGNILNPLCLKRYFGYDIIFCRNLLIYLQPTARRCALNNLNRLLKPNGLLFVGYSEASQIDTQQFQSVAVPQSFAYRKIPMPIKRSMSSDTSISGSNGSVPNKSAPNQSVSNQFVQNKSSALNKIRMSGTARDIAPSYTLPRRNLKQLSTVSHHLSVMPHQEQVPTKGIADIRALADRGELASALAHCKRHLESNPTSAAAYLLLGEIYQAQDNSEQADSAFKKALYLYPKCIKSLTHRLQIWEKKGDSVVASRLRLRLTRLLDSP